LNTRASKGWSRFDNYLQILQSFGVYSPEEVEESILSAEAKIPQVQEDSLACNLGIEFYLKQNMVERFGDFILGDQSPYKNPYRISMGGSYMQPNF